MQIPRWVVFLVAAWVLLFGGYRLSIAFRRRGKKTAADDDERPNFQKRGLWAQSSRRHILFGLLYVVLGSYLVAMGLGYGINFRALFE